MSSLIERSLNKFRQSGQCVALKLPCNFVGKFVVKLRVCQHCVILFVLYSLIRLVWTNMSPLTLSNILLKGNSQRVNSFKVCVKIIYLWIETYSYIVNKYLLTFIILRVILIYSTSISSMKSIKINHSHVGLCGGYIYFVCLQ